MQQRDHRVDQRERDLDAEPALLEIGELRRPLAHLPQLRQHPRVEQAGDVEIGVAVVAQLDDGGHVTGVEEHRHLRLGIVDGGEHLRRRLEEGRLGDLGVGLVDEADVLVEHHHRGQAADRGLDGEKLVELLARLVEQGLRARTSSMAIAMFSARANCTCSRT